jgi:hypothetical protein
MGVCYNSHSVAMQTDLLQITARIPVEPEALGQLHALGFRNVVVHVARSGSEPALLEPLPKPARLVARTSRLILYHLESEQQIRSSLEIFELEPGEVSSQVDLPAGGQHRLVFPFRSRAGSAFRHPDPIVPSNVVVRWIDPEGSTVAVEPLRMLLPIALAPHGRWDRSATIRVPDAPGAYRVELALADAPARVLSRVAARVVDPPAVGAAAPGARSRGAGIGRS